MTSSSSGDFPSVSNSIDLQAYVMARGYEASVRRPLCGLKPPAGWEMDVRCLGCCHGDP